MTDCNPEKKRGWLGWCPLTGSLQTALAESSHSHAPEEHAGPDGGGNGGRNRAGRGAGFAAESAKFLVKNKNLLWFSLLTGLVAVFVFTTHYIWHVLARYPYNLIGYPGFIYPQFLIYDPFGLLLTFAIELVTIFCMVILLAGLVLVISTGQSGERISLHEGFSKIRGHIRPLAGWSVILSLTGTVLYVIIQYSGFPAGNIDRMLNQFPFYFIISPEVYGRGPIAGGFHTISALTTTIVLMAVNILLLILTFYVVPAIVLGNRRLPDAIAGMVPFLRRTWAEILICFSLIGLTVSGAALLSLLFRVVYGIVAPDQLLIWYPGDAWMAGAVLFMIALCAFAFAGSTVGGIAGLKIYSYGKPGDLDSAGEEEQEAAL